MDYFNGKSNEDFLNFFKEVLFCRTELTQYTYPYEEFEPDEAVDDHITRCQSILIEKIMDSISDAEFENKIKLNEDEISSLYKEKRVELDPFMTEQIEKYIKSVKVEYVDLRKESEN